MSSPNDDDSAPNAREKGAIARQPVADEETTSELELLELTPTPVAVPLDPQSVKPPPVAAPPRGSRPPPLPRKTAPPPPPPRAAQPRPPARRPPPPPPPGAHLEDAEAPAPAGPSPAAAPASIPAQPSAPAPAPPSLGAHTVPLPAVAAPPARPAEIERFSADVAVADARTRVEQSAAGERTVLARARLELGLLLEVTVGDSAAALTEYRAAHGVAAHLLAPVAAARRLTPSRPAAPAIALFEAEVQATHDPATRLTRQLELGMLLSSSGAPAERTAQIHREVLAVEPAHPGALRGLEAALSPSPRVPETQQQMDALASHLETMGSALRDDTRLSAWLEVERGQLLERLGRHDAARAAFAAALALDGRIGPVRDAYVRHLLLQGQVEGLVKAWAVEAGLETDPARAARLLYVAGRLAAERLDQKAQAIELFERAAGGEQAAPSTRRAALRELVRLHEATGQLDRAAATANRLLAFARDAEQPYWHRRLVPLCEALGRSAELAAHAQQVVAAEPGDEAMREKLDRALAALGRHGDRVAMLTEQAAQAGTTAARVALLERAATIAEHDLGRPDLALFSLRAAWAADPGSADVADAILRLLTPGAPPSLTDPNDPSRVRARIDFHIEAAASATDPARRIAHLEKLASIWEDEVRDPARALTVHAEILALEPRRRSAILGLARCAGRAGDARELLRALVLEADQVDGDPLLERSLLLRAAEVASSQLNEPDAALELVKRVLAKGGGDPDALRVAFRVHDRAGRSAEALAQLRALLGQTKKGAASYAVQAEIARFLEERMRRTADALTAWREAHRLDPSNPTPRAEIRRILLANGDHRAVAEELAALGGATQLPAQRGEMLLEAAEIYDDRLNDVERAIPLLAEALQCLPDDPILVERLDRAYLRSGKRSERLALLLAQAQASRSAPATYVRDLLTIATLQADERDPGKAGQHLPELAASEVTATAALRVLEHAYRRAERWSELDAVLRLQIKCFATHAAKLGSVYELVALEEYGDVRPPDGQPTARDLLAKLAPDDLLPPELLLKRSTLALGGQTPPRILATALGTVAGATPDPLAAAALEVAAGLLVENAEEPSFHGQKEALLAYALALEGWPDCVTAARGARRMALRLGEMPTFVKAAAALGELEAEPALRAQRLLEAAHGLRGQPDSAARAFDLCCRALGEDPNSPRAADAVIAAVGQGLDAGRAGEVLRTALDRALSPDQAAKLGTALAHLALTSLGDHTVALEALRRARKRAPKHVGILLALADVANVLGQHSEAVEAATNARGLAREPGERLRATIAMAEVHVRAPAFRDTARREAKEAERLAEQVPGDGEILGRLGSIYRLLGDPASAERVLLAALTLGGDASRALDQLVGLHGGSREAGERIATALRQAMTDAHAAGRAPRPEWLAALGKVEATLLGRPAEGLAHLREATRLDPGRVETYRDLAEAHGASHDEAARELAAMAVAFSRSAPTAPRIETFLGLLEQEARQGQRQPLADTARDLLACLGGRDVTVSGRSPAPFLGGLAPGALRREALVGALLHDPAQAPLLDVATLLAEPVTRLVRREPESLGLASRDRLAARASHPVRLLADRIARAFGEPRFDLYLDGGSLEGGRLLPGEPTAMVLPTGFGERPEAEQAVTLTRLLAYLALDLPWVEGLPVADTDGILFGALRVGLGLWGQGDLSPSAEASASLWRPRFGKLGRRSKRTLEEIAQRLRAPADSQAWREAVHITALRAAFVVSGRIDLVLRQAMALDGGFAKVAGQGLAAALFGRALTREVATFALSDVAWSLRQAASSTAA